MANERYWNEKGYKPGRKKIFQTPKELWDASKKYFNWVMDNPILEQRPFSYMGNITYAEVEKPRPMSVYRMCSYIGMDYSTYTRYRKNEKYKEVCNAIDTIIRENKFEGAASGQMNPVIIARDLGLRDNIDHTSGGEKIDSKPSVVIDNAQLVAKDVQDILDKI